MPGKISRPWFHNRLPLPILILAGLLPVIFFCARLFDADLPVTIPVRALKQEPKTLDEFPSGVVYSEGNFAISNPTLVQRFLCPSDDFIGDPLYDLWLVAALVVGYVYLRDFSREDPFTRQTVGGIKALLRITVAVVLIGMFRNYWMHTEVRTLTNLAYVARTPAMFRLPEFWALLALMRLQQVFVKGYQLTLDQQYTV